MAQPHPQDFRGNPAPFRTRCGIPEPHRSWISAISARLGAPAVLAGLAMGCAAPTEAAPEDVRVELANDGSRPDIFGGERDGDDRALPGVVALRVGVSGTFELCTGALVAPNVVLTARHCVTKNTTASVACDEEGRSANGPHVLGDESPATIGIYTGATPSFSRRPVALGRAVISPQGGYLCDADIALVVLDRALPVEPLSVRLSAGAEVGETIRAVGYGQNDASTPIGTRFRREGVRVLAQGKGLSASRTPLGANEFEVGTSICQGDSGGPAISESTGAVIGVVSRGGKCEDDFGHIYTTTAGFEEMFAQAFQLAGGEPKVESQAQLQSVRASLAGAGPKTAEPTPEAAGCTLGRRPVGGEGLAGAAALALGLLAARRRRRSC